MAVLKLKRSQDAGRKEENGPSKKIKIKTKLKVKNEDISAAKALPKPKVRISLKPKFKEENIPRSNPLKVKLNLKAKPEKESKCDVPKPPRLRLKPIRVPGEGYDSEASDIETDPLIESGIILRVLSDTQVDFVKNSIEAGDYSGISITWKDERHAIVNINGYQYGAVLVDLPTIVEVNKSVDRKNLLKTFDVCQMLVCIRIIDKEEEVFGLKVPDTEDLASKHFEEIEDEIERNKLQVFRQQHPTQIADAEQTHLKDIACNTYDYKHGITPPLYNVRNRRFRRKISGTEFDYVENVVELLLNQDDQAEEVNFNLLHESELNSNTGVVSTPSQTQMLPVPPAVQQLQPQQQTADLIETYTDTMMEDEDELDLEAAFNSEEEDEQKSLDISTKSNVFPTSNGDTTNLEPQYGQVEEVAEEDEGDEEEEEEDDEDDEEEEEEEEDDDEEEEGPGGRPKKDEHRQHVNLLIDELKELETTLSHTKRKAEKATNPLLKSRFVDNIKKLEKEMELKRKQLKSSESLLNKQQGTVPLETKPETPLEEEDDEENEDDEDEDDEEEEEEEEEEITNAAATAENTPNQDTVGTVGTVGTVPDQEPQLDQNDLDMMMLFGAEAEEDED
ncbi:TATA-binding protein-associated factor TAF7 KNAG_0J02160 [Huiozyma naganishii CBS 8797]|uniref:TAFII55 protein conserved region domain-containing protein n=1 Tax=Huiozyma naganishii (strain ATCC MYA-139 / BCRC 22969 / CBS 8797 / KCTC 17520 / NBRC 10181 / NCYC 3082 / Yp74L-3) TaxID=1071383 RepID=J7S2X7_HUIN7|nr:hypothetical protein KNAG_0J02160 [Kazachstania naganishii CBS 8797]CCK72297.1 hypothetical protein KNAG_0J02160 [Kazachstania naganishii CBS 8797]